jgi:hypothetical protein
MTGRSCAAAAAAAAAFHHTMQTQTGAQVLQAVLPGCALAAPAVLISVVPMLSTQVLLLLCCCHIAARECDRG